MGRRRLPSFFSTSSVMLLGVVALLVTTSSAVAGYRVIGAIKAQECWDFGIVMSCSSSTVTEVRRKGKRYRIPDHFDTVDEYNKDDSRCWIHTKSREHGLLSWGINLIAQPELWGFDADGEYGEIDADYIVFKCAKD